jgi:hypothetical protein
MGEESIDALTYQLHGSVLAASNTALPPTPPEKLQCEIEARV